MKNRILFPILGIFALVLFQSLEIRAAEPQVAPADTFKPPVIVKKGTLDLDLCETTPFVFHGRLYRLEWFRKEHCLRIVDQETNKEVAGSRFGEHRRFPCAYVEGDTVYVIGTSEDKGWCGTTLDLFTSKNLTNWDEQVAYHNPDFKMCNTSVCKADGRYVMSVEIAVGGYIGRFLESKDLIHWTLMPPECGIGSGSAHLVRYANGWYYLFVTVGGNPKGYVLMLRRSRDLKKWEMSPFNPVMYASQDDHLVLNKNLTPEQQKKISRAPDCDNSDIDFCEYEGKLIINYNWGNQQGDSEFIAEAEYAGTMAQFLEGWFPAKAAAPPH